MRPHVWKEDEIFVFGSNVDGVHGAGAALFARMHCGAQLGVGEGLTGNSYALPTCRHAGVPLTLDEVRESVETFLSLADGEPDMTFFLTRVGCGLAGFTDTEIAWLFAEIPPNVIVPPEWDGLTWDDKNRGIMSTWNR